VPITVHRAALISVSLALNQAPVYTVRPRLRGWCIARCACLRPSFRWYSLRLPTLFRRAGTVFWLGGVKIMRATFLGVHKSVINDNKNTLRPSFRIYYNYDVHCVWVCTIKYFQEISGVKIPCLTPQVNFPGSFDPWPSGSHAPGVVWKRDT